MTVNRDEIASVIRCLELGNGKVSIFNPDMTALVKLLNLLRGRLKVNVEVSTSIVNGEIKVTGYILTIIKKMV